MRRALDIVDVVNERSGKVLSMVILAIISILIVEVTARYIFNAPTIWAHELCRHGFGAYVMLAGAYVLVCHEHVRVDIIYNRFPPRWRASLDMVASLMLFLFVTIVLVFGAKMAWHSVQIAETTNSPWASPLYPVRLTIPIGAFLILLQGLAQFIRSFRRVVTGGRIK